MYQIQDMGSWLFVLIYYLAQILFLIGGIFLARKRKDGIGVLIVIGFTAFLIGNIAMILLSRENTELLQLKQSNDTIRYLYQFSRFLSSVGFLLAGGCFLLINKKKHLEHT
jgi:hypothetical protein